MSRITDLTHQLDDGLITWEEYRLAMCDVLSGRVPNNPPKPEPVQLEFDFGE